MRITTFKQLKQYLFPGSLAPVSAEPTVMATAPDDTPAAPPPTPKKRKSRRKAKKKRRRARR